VIGKPVDRVDGPLKTSGAARYAYERHEFARDAAYGFIVGAAIAKGRILAIDTAAASRASGVLAVLTAANTGGIAKGPMNTAKLLAGPEVQHYHQAVALVVAETFEQARSAAAMVMVDYDRTPGAYDLEAARSTAAKPAGGSPDSELGNFAAAFAAAAVQVDATYKTPDVTHAMMEPHATIAAWRGDELMLWTSTQMVDWNRGGIAATLGIPKEKVHLSCPYVGGGFGAKLFPRADAVLAALAARAVGRPVKVALERALIVNNTTHRPATIQRVRIGAERNGRIVAIAHESWSGDLPGGRPDNAVHQTRVLYSAPHQMTTTRLAVLDLPESSAMRAPGEATGHMALEAAMDEMAEKLGIDPVQFRIINDTQSVPVETRALQGQSLGSEDNSAAVARKPFSQRQLAECLQVGARRFGWSRRNPKPGQLREGDLLIGVGVASAYRGAPTMKSAARVRLDSMGVVTVETDMTDIGTGSYTIIAQTAAEMMGVSLDRVVVKLAESDFPVSAGSGGQYGAASSTAGVYAACVKLHEAVAQKLNLTANDIEFADGQVRWSGGSVPLAQAGGTQGEDFIEFGDLAERFHQATFGAHFVEVSVDAVTAEVRLRRMLAVCASGRILNPKTARSQIIGAMTMGAGSALMEELAIDKRLGFFVNHDLASYEVPVHADIPHQDVVFLDETDALSSPMKAKGVSELGICGVAAAIANAVYNATGVRVRDYPITLDKLIDKLPSA
jgi:xanthine dehydrogenase YagR molybdenum-binding subunit